MRTEAVTSKWHSVEVSKLESVYILGKGTLAPPTWELGLNVPSFSVVAAVVLLKKIEIQSSDFFLINLFILFIYFWLHWVFVVAHRVSLVAASRGYSSLWCTGFSLRWLLLLRSTGSRHPGFSSCGTRAQQLWLAGSRAQTQ